MEGGILFRKTRFAFVFAVFATCNLLGCAAAIVGTYEGVIEEEGSRIDLVFRCDSEASCELETTSAKGGDKPQVASIERYSAQKVDTTEARRALKYARDHRALAAKPEYRAAARQLMPLLESDADVSHCLALELGSIVCELASSPWGKPTLLFFGTDLANCNESRLFCAYVFVPLFQRSSTAAMTPKKPLPEAKRPRAPTDAEISVTPPDMYRRQILYGGDPTNDQVNAASREVREGLRLYRNRQFAEAYAQLLPEAERGDWIAQATIGAMYADGLARPRDLQQAMYWLRKASDQGSLWAAETIGRIYDDGILVPRDIEEAKKWYAKGGQNPRDPSITMRLAELVLAKRDTLFWTDPPTNSFYFEPRNWVAWAQREAFVYDLYERLDSIAKLPRTFPKGLRLYIHIGLAADGTVTSVQHQNWFASGGPPSEEANAWAIAMLDAIRTASPLPPPPSWVPREAKIAVIYPPKFREEGYFDRDGNRVLPRQTR